MHTPNHFCRPDDGQLSLREDSWLHQGSQWFVTTLVHGTIICQILLSKFLTHAFTSKSLVQPRILQPLVQH